MHACTYPNPIYKQATATKRIQEDILKQLALKNTVRFTQSFNRPNLSYEICVKKKKCVDDIASMIRTRFKHDAGIIYCFSRKECEDTALVYIHTCIHINT